MRLIDADNFKGKVIASHCYSGVNRLISINDVPTAYDVDKVVEQLKNNTYNMEICEEIPSKRKDIATFVDKEYKMIKLDDAIEIVKGGGIGGNTNT